MKNLRAYVAEFIATFMLTLGVALSIASGSAITPLIAALTVGIFVYTIGPISGAHINPAVTVGLASVKKIDVKEAAFYIIAQFIGAVLAMLAVKAIAGDAVNVGATNDVMAGVMEALGAFVLVFGVSSVVYKNVDSGAAGLTIGGSLLIGILAASSKANGVLNPAVALGIGSVSLMYVLGPLVGGIAGAWAYKYVAKKK